MVDKQKPIKMQLPTKKAAATIMGGKGSLVKDGEASKTFSSSSVVSVPITKAAQYAGAAANVIMTQPMFFSPLHTPQNWQIASKRKEVYQWARFYYENEPKVAAGIDFYSQFPINGFKLLCKKKSILKYYERMIEKIDLMYWLRMISHQRFLLGDVFVMTEISCPHCHGTGVDKETNEICNHADGTIGKITVLNPDWIEVMKTPISQDPQIVLLPDEEIQRVIQTRQPKFLYDQIPDNIKAQIMAKKPILLSNRVTSHIKHGGSPYGTYGESLIRRLFTVLAYKTKLMTANWIVAERLILPIRVVKIGSDERPADDEAIADASAQLAAVANDPNLTIVTHNHFEYDWYGASGKIHQITTELEAIGKDILDGLMLNQALLNGEMAGYSAAQIGVETMVRRIDSWRNELAQWIEKHIFLPIAKMQGFVDEQESEEAKETVYLYPRIKWNDLRLRDNSNQLQMFFQMQQGGIISAQTLLEQFDLDYDIEIERIRDEQMQAAQSGQMTGAGMPMAGGMPPLGGGAPAAPSPAAPMGPEVGGAPLGGAAGGMPAAASATPEKIYRRGKAPKKEEIEVQPVKMTTIQLTRPESKMYRTLTAMQLPFELYAQYKQPVNNKSNFYLMDFAIPSLGVDIEVDGEKWHSSVEDKQKDRERDVTLASMGWRVIRFTEVAINEHMDKIVQVIKKEVESAAAEKRALSKKSESITYKHVEFSPFDGCVVQKGKPLSSEVKQG